ncbi:hypothetical protein V6N11_051188 [Hibiscus sabdariffa]|uniref:Secreted protein n=2 Tax=Hibiscus sabdariffa TaxID=183260 RepID=A0ABR2A1P3_9ROSI
MDIFFLQLQHLVFFSQQLLDPQLLKHILHFLQVFLEKLLACSVSLWPKSGNPENHVVDCRRGHPYCGCIPKPKPHNCDGVYSRGGYSDDSAP